MLMRNRKPRVYWWPMKQWGLTMSALFGNGELAARRNRQPAFIMCCTVTYMALISHGIIADDGTLWWLTLAGVVSSVWASVIDSNFFLLDPVHLYLEISTQFMAQIYVKGDERWFPPVWCFSISIRSIGRCLERWCWNFCSWSHPWWQPTAIIKKADYPFLDFCNISFRNQLRWQQSSDRRPSAQWAHPELLLVLMEAHLLSHGLPHLKQNQSYRYMWKIHKELRDI